MNPAALLLAPVRLFIQTVMLALGQVWANKVRALLTTLGIIIGVGAVVFVIALLTGMRTLVLDTFDSAVGARKMWLWGQVPESKREVMSWEDAKVSSYEARLIADAESIEVITPLCRLGLSATYGRRTENSVDITGVWPEWHTTESRTVILGRQLSRTDLDEKLQVCLINEAGAEELRLPRDPTGEYILLGGRRFLIVGVLETKEVGGIFGGGESEAEIFIPFSTAKNINPYTGTWFEALIVDTDAADEARAEARYILRNHRGLRGEDEDTFGLELSQNAIGQFDVVAGVIGVVAVGIVSISLVVGGIGIMNIMLVSVSERTREIGLRKAVGARPAVVLVQFLVEAIVLCLLGGAVGLAAGSGSTELVKILQPDQFGKASIPTWAIMISVGSCGIVGIVAGMFPAAKAAALRPIDALRHE